MPALYAKALEVIYSTILKNNCPIYFATAIQANPKGDLGVYHLYGLSLNTSTHCSYNAIKQIEYKNYSDRMRIKESIKRGFVP